jgi:hypothetical protein
MGPKQYNKSVWDRLREEMAADAHGSGRYHSDIAHRLATQSVDSH